MPIQRVSDIEGEPEVGRFYLVPCVRHRGRWIPVIGPPHDDAEYIGVAERHYHRDLRFLADDIVEDGYDYHVTFNDYVVCTPEELAMITIPFVATLQGGPVEMRVKCRRRMPDFPIVTNYRAPWFDRLQDGYKDASAKCGRCPHRGFSLKGLPMKDGNVICPGHGLRWNVETGEMVPRC